MTDSRTRRMKAAYTRYKSFEDEPAIPAEDTSYRGWLTSSDNKAHDDKMIEHVSKLTSSRQGIKQVSEALEQLKYIWKEIEQAYADAFEKEVVYDRAYYEALDEIVVLVMDTFPPAQGGGRFATFISNLHQALVFAADVQSSDDAQNALMDVAKHCEGAIEFLMEADQALSSGKTSKAKSKTDKSRSSSKGRKS